jgi:hypothetical protein
MKKVKLSNLAAVSIAISVSISSVALAADDYAFLNDPWRVYVGAFNASVNSEIGINGDELPPGPPIDVEDVLGVEDSKTVAWGGIAWHFAPRHSLEFEIFALNRSDSVSDTYDPPLQVGDLFIEDGQISTSYDTNLARLTYGFSIMRSERYELQLEAGLHIASLEVALQLAGAICDPTTTPAVPPGCPAGNSGDGGEDVTAPLPHFGASFVYVFTPTLAMQVGAKGFAIELDQIDGSIIEIDADVVWQPWRNIGLGAGVRYFNTDVKSKGSDLNGSFKFEYIGPTVYVQATF